jgi:hypothetical protein
MFHARESSDSDTTVPAGTYIVIRSEKAMMAFMDQACRAGLFTHLRAEGSISLIRRKKSCPQRGQRKLCL